MPKLVDHQHIKIEPVNRYGRVNVSIGSYRHSLSLEDTMRLRDAINMFLFFKTDQGVDCSDYIPEENDE